MIHIRSKLARGFRFKSAVFVLTSCFLEVNISMIKNRIIDLSFFRNVSNSCIFFFCKGDGSYSSVYKVKRIEDG